MALRLLTSASRIPCEERRRVRSSVRAGRWQGRTRGNRGAIRHGMAQREAVDSPCLQILFIIPNDPQLCHPKDFRI